MDSLSLWPALPVDVELISLRCDPCDGEPRALLVALQNLGPCRRRWALPPGWRLLGRVDGLGRPEGPNRTSLRPWELGFWRLAPAADQSS